MLYGLIYGVHLGIGGPKKDMAVLMSLNQNGQAITLSSKLAEKRASTDGAWLARSMAEESGDYAFAQTFPTGTHAMWLYYWLAPTASIRMHGRQGASTVPPPQMVANMRDGQHGRLLRGRARGARAPSWTRYRLHRGHHAGNLDRPSGESRWAPRRNSSPEISEHRARE